jgi:hypothetical protein
MSETSGLKYSSENNLHNLYYTFIDINCIIMNVYYQTVFKSRFVGSTILDKRNPFKMKLILFVCLGFYVTSTQYRSYRDVPALLVEEDLRCPSVHYFRHGRAPE